MRTGLFWLLFSFCISFSQAQWNEGSLVPVPLDDLSFFRSAARNWKIEGDAFGLPYTQHHLEVSPGKGILVNKPTATDKDNLASVREFGDLDLEVDVLVPRGSNSGIYLMGRYEVQILDSYGKLNAAFSDFGGIYQRWDPGRGKGKEGFEGVPPQVNAAKAPGLWQNLKISFEAPRFSPEGKKIQNARFLAVWLNGIRIHTLVEVSGPTRGAAFSQEADKGPILIQGDHGPVAFRNLRIAPSGNPGLAFEDLRYQVFYGEHRSPEAFRKSPVVHSGTAQALDAAHADSPDDFMILYNGNLRVQTPGRYSFSLELSGKAYFRLDGRLLLDTVKGGFWWHKRTVDTTLEAGLHAFELGYLKSNPRGNPSLGFRYSGPGIKVRNLHAPGSLSPNLPGGQFLLQREAAPFAQRSFFQVKGKTIPYGISICHPQGVHYSLNLRTGRLVRAWRSTSFGEVSTMWSDRGSKQTLYPIVPIQEWTEPALIGIDPDQYPDSLTEGKGLRYLGYRDRKEAGFSFDYQIQDGDWELQCQPEGPELRVELKPHPGKEPATRLWHALAEGKQIRRLPDGLFLVDESFYVKVDKASEPALKIVTAGKHQRILLPLASRNNPAVCRYSLIW